MSPVLGSARDPYLSRKSFTVLFRSIPLARPLSSPSVLSPFYPYPNPVTAQQQPCLGWPSRTRSAPSFLPYLYCALSLFKPSQSLARFLDTCLASLSDIPPTPRRLIPALTRLLVSDMPLVLCRPRLPHVTVSRACAFRAKYRS